MCSGGSRGRARRSVPGPRGGSRLVIAGLATLRSRARWLTTGLDHGGIRSERPHETPSSAGSACAPTQSPTSSAPGSNMAGWSSTNTLTVSGHPGLYAVGDAAAVPARPGELTPMTAQHAQRQGQGAACNLAGSYAPGRRRQPGRAGLLIVVFQCLAICAPSARPAQWPASRWPDQRLTGPGGYRYRDSDSRSREGHAFTSKPTPLEELCDQRRPTGHWKMCCPSG